MVIQLFTLTISLGNVYIADTYNNRIRKVTVSSGIINTFAGSGATGSTSGSYSGDNGQATSATVNTPLTVALDSAGNVYFTDTYNHRIRKVTVSTGIITTIAGSSASTGYSGDNGQATSATLNFPKGVSLDTAGNVYIGDTNNHRIRKVTISTGIITTIAGGSSSSFSGDNGPATSAGITYPWGAAVDAAGNLYISETPNNRIRKVTVSTGIITTYAGTGTASYSGDGGAATSASLYYPEGVFMDSSGYYFRKSSSSSLLLLSLSSGNLYIGDQFNNRIRKVTTISPSATPTRVPTMTPSTSVPTVTPRYLPLFFLTTSLSYSTDLSLHLA